MLYAVDLDDPDLTIFLTKSLLSKDLQWGGGSGYLMSPSTSLDIAEGFSVEILVAHGS